MDRFALEQFRRSALASLPGEILGSLPAVYRTALVERGEPPRIVVNFGQHEWPVFPKNTKPPSEWDPERAERDPLYAIAHLVELGLSVHRVDLNSGFLEKPKKAELRMLSKYEPLSKLAGVGLVSMPLRGAGKVIAPGLAAARRLDFSGARVDLAGLDSVDWPELEYVGLGRADGDCATLARLLQRMPSLKGAGLPSVALDAASGLAERARGWDYLDLQVGDDESIRRVRSQGWLGQALSHLRLEGWARGGPSTLSALAGASLPSLVALRLTAVGEEELPEAVELPSLRALKIAPYYASVVAWMASQSWLRQLHVLDLDAHSITDSKALVEPLRVALAGETSVLRLRGPSSKPPLLDLLGDASSETLRALEVRQVEVSAATIAQLAARFPRLEALSIAAPFGTEEVAALAAFDQRLLHVGCDGKVRNDAFARLLELPLTRSVQCLNLPRTVLDEEHLQRFIDAEMPALVEAHLKIGRIKGGSTAAAIETSDRKPHLAWLTGVAGSKESKGQRVRCTPASYRPRLEWGRSFLLRPKFR
jgi:hypothetical protein